MTRRRKASLQAAKMLGLLGHISTVYGRLGELMVSVRICFEDQEDPRMDNGLNILEDREEPMTDDDGDSDKGSSGGSGDTSVPVGAS